MVKSSATQRDKYVMKTGRQSVPIALKLSISRTEEQPANDRLSGKCRDFYRPRIEIRNLSAFVVWARKIETSISPCLSLSIFPSVRLYSKEDLDADKKISCGSIMGQLVKNQRLYKPNICSRTVKKMLANEFKMLHWI